MSAPAPVPAANGKFRHKPVIVEVPRSEFEAEFGALPEPGDGDERPEERPVMGSSAGAAAREAEHSVEVILLNLVKAKGDLEDALYKAAYEVGRLVGFGYHDRTLVAHLLLAACGANGLVLRIGENEVGAAIEVGLDDGERAAAQERAAEAKSDTGGAIPTEADLSDDFVERHGDELRYVAKWGRWLFYDGQVWRDERTHLVRDLAKELCRGAAGKADTKDLRSLASARTVAAVQTLAQAHRRIAATVEQWDADPWMLNTPAGLVDLHSGEMMRRTPADYVTKMTGTAPAGDSGCPMWAQFLSRIFNDNHELIAYVQRVLGYSLTGITKEQAMFFAYGTGGNGKSVLFDTVAGILGDYHTTAAIETFTASSSDRHTTEVADLVGARLVTAMETEQGRAWAEARIKTLTGGDRVKARFMRQDNFTFEPQFKLLVAGNHQPTLRTVDEAIRRRFNLLPFTVTIPPDQRDLELASKLRGEWPGVLRWMIDGCLAWQRNGLKPPAAVVDATRGYLETQDAMTAWIDERCEQARAYQTRASELFASWKVYADKAGEPAGSTKTFGPQLEARGFPRSPSRRAGSVYMGIRIRLKGEGEEGE